VLLLTAAADDDDDDDSANGVLHRTASSGKKETSIRQESLDLVSIQAHRPITATNDDEQDCETLRIEKKFVGASRKNSHEIATTLESKHRSSSLFLRKQQQTQTQTQMQTN
jgi:hypothetical protein